MQTKPLYDAVAGGIANDKVFNTIDLFFAGIISKAEALGRLKFEVPNHQLCILNENLIRKHLHFINWPESKDYFTNYLFFFNTS